MRQDVQCSVLVLTITALSAPCVPCPFGEFLKPFTLCHMPPPTKPNPNAPPTSPTMRWGQGSLSAMRDPSLRRAYSMSSGHSRAFSAQTWSVGHSQKINYTFAVFVRWLWSRRNRDGYVSPNETAPDPCHSRNYPAVATYQLELLSSPADGWLLGSGCWLVAAHSHTSRSNYSHLCTPPYLCKTPHKKEERPDRKHD